MVAIFLNLNWAHGNLLFMTTTCNKTRRKNKTFTTTNEYTLESSSKRVSFRWALELVHIIFIMQTWNKTPLNIMTKQS